MRYLFYIVHPSKFHLFKFTINELKENNTVDIIINSKDVLEDLIKEEGWAYYNLFPYGRNKSKKPSIVKSGVNFLLTILKLEFFLFKNKKYDLFITDDSLVVNAWLRRKKSYLFCDNDIRTIKHIKILFYFAFRIIAPHTTDLGSFLSKKISFKGNKAIAHLHSDYFSPSLKTLSRYNLIKYNYFVIRLAHLNATHDIGDNRGITDKNLKTLIDLVKDRYQILIISEREVPIYARGMLYKGLPSDIKDIIYFSHFIVSDSGTMATEAAVMGTPNILINKLAKEIGVHRELEDKNLQFYYDDFESATSKITSFINDKNLLIEWDKNKKRYLENCDDLNKLMIENFTKGEIQN
ncbi:MAG: hypothetical protein CMG59_06315 [Candidatus Marinimicrobia bacterium]|nr:hypothetical protein [Candidatus Neomarinimicrobiota bacterium]